MPYLRIRAHVRPTLPTLQPCYNHVSMRVCAEQGLFSTRANPAPNPALLGPHIALCPKVIDLSFKRVLVWVAYLEDHA